jgi:hypothetical protein
MRDPSSTLHAVIPVKAVILSDSGNRKYRSVTKWVDAGFFTGMSIFLCELNI